MHVCVCVCPWIYILRNSKQDFQDILHTHVHHSIIHCNQNVEATKISIDKQMDKKCGIYKQWNMMPPLKGKKPCNTMD